MTNDDPVGDNTATNPHKNTAAPRKSRTVRFSDSEWKQVETAAKERAMPAAQFVRRAALRLSGTDPTPDSANLPPEIVALIESTYRYAYIAATLKRDELIREQRGDEVNAVVRAARESQTLLLNQASV